MRSVRGDVARRFLRKRSRDERKCEGHVPGLCWKFRNDARKGKNFALSDAIRDKLKALDVTIEDSAQGTRWKIG